MDYWLFVCCARWRIDKKYTRALFSRTSCDIFNSIERSKIAWTKVSRRRSEEIEKEECAYSKYSQFMCFMSNKIHITIFLTATMKKTGKKRAEAKNHNNYKTKNMPFYIRTATAVATTMNNDDRPHKDVMQCALLCIRSNMLQYMCW